MDVNGPAFRHWIDEEDFLYYLFLILKKIPLVQAPREIGFYTEMSAFIGTKTSVQCRSHHQKKLLNLRKKTGVVQDKLALQILNLKAFYKKAYADRLRGKRDLLEELYHHLALKIVEETKYQENYIGYYERSQEIVQSLISRIGTLDESKPKMSQLEFIDSILCHQK